MVHHSFDPGKTRRYNDKRRLRCRFLWNWNKHRNTTTTPKATIRNTPSKLQNLIDELLVSIESHNVNSVVDLLSSSQGQGQEKEIVAVNGIYSECFSMTLLHVAVDCSENKTEIVEALLKSGGDPNNVNVEAGLSPLHLSVMLDYDSVLEILLQYGGDPSILTPEGRDCYFLAVQNVQEQMKDKCYTYFAKTSEKFLESLAGSGLHSSSSKDRVSCSITQDSGGGDEFYSCDDSINQNGVIVLEKGRHLNDIPGRFLPVDFDFECQTTEDETSVVITPQEEKAGAKLTSTTKPKESGLGPQSSIPSSPTENANGSCSSPSCLEPTPPIIPQPTKAEIETLREQMKKLNIPVTPSTYSVISRCAENQSLLEMILQPKVGTCNFSSELRHGIQNLNLIEEWGKQKIDFLENNLFATNNHKIFNNYLLLDPKIINENGTFFSGEPLKTVMESSEKFEMFLRSVFYIGKAHDGRRPLQHLIEAKAKHKWTAMGRSMPSMTFGEKLDRILKIWSSGMGIIIVSVFHHSTEREANVREACMIDSIGLVELSNQKKGSYGGILATQKMKNQLGTSLLYKSFCSFVINDPKQFYPQDF